jgi:hypothetical protein
LPGKEGRKEGNPNQSGAVPNDDDDDAGTVLCFVRCVRNTSRNKAKPVYA